MKYKYPVGTLIYHRHIGFGVVVGMVKTVIIKPGMQYSVKWISQEGVSLYNESYMDALVENYDREMVEG